MARVDAVKQQVFQAVETRIHFVRGMKVMLSHDLAPLYEVETKALMQAVRRNPSRFPEDFSFKLTNQEVRDLRSQTVTLDSGLRTYAPHAFTEQGIAMLSTVLRSERAVAVNIEIMRAFVRMRALIEANRDLSRRLDTLESKYDKQFKVVFDAMRQLMVPPEVSKKRSIGFVQND